QNMKSEKGAQVGRAGKRAKGVFKLGSQPRRRNSRFTANAQEECNVSGDTSRVSGRTDSFRVLLLGFEPFGDLVEVESSGDSPQRHAALVIQAVNQVRAELEIITEERAVELVPDRRKGLQRWCVLS